jgi:hypothetical protein
MTEGSRTHCVRVINIQLDLLPSQSPYSICVLESIDPQYGVAQGRRMSGCAWNGHSKTEMKPELVVHT